MNRKYEPMTRLHTLPNNTNMTQAITTSTETKMKEHGRIPERQVGASGTVQKYFHVLTHP